LLGTDVTSVIPGSVDALAVSELVFSSAIGFSSNKLFSFIVAQPILRLLRCWVQAISLEEIY
jgi:hypothetical protein